MICDYRLKVFYTVALKGSFTAAAKELGITQPAVSNHISELEGSIGDLLFLRSRKETGLTQKGRILFDYAERILNLYRCAERELVPAKRDERKHLVIAAAPEAARFVLKPLAEYYTRIHPGTELTVLERDMDETASLLEEADVDIAVTDTPWKNGDNTVFATLTVNGASSPMTKYYIRRSHGSDNSRTIDDFLLCCKTYR